MAFAACFAADRIIARQAAGRIATQPDDVRPADVALVLGTVKTVNGRPNYFYEARLDTAVALFRAGKVRGLLVSGDNSRRDYDEPTAMRRDLIARGIPAEFITCDYAGFSTLDSVQRLRPVFGQANAIIISQRFHLERALYLADAAGVQASGCAAADAPRWWAVRTRVREILARGKAVLDVTFGRGPHFLGPREEVRLARRLQPELIR